jgi:hypothetical protein
MRWGRRIADGESYLNIRIESKIRRRRMPITAPSINDNNNLEIMYIYYHGKQ